MSLSSARRNSSNTSRSLDRHHPSNMSRSSDRRLEETKKPKGPGTLRRQSNPGAPQAATGNWSLLRRSLTPEFVFAVSFPAVCAEFGVENIPLVELRPIAETVFASDSVELHPIAETVTPSLKKEVVMVTSSTSSSKSRRPKAGKVASSSRNRHSEKSDDEAFALSVTFSSLKSTSLHETPKSSGVISPITKSVRRKSHAGRLLTQASTLPSGAATLGPRPPPPDAPGGPGNMVPAPALVPRPPGGTAPASALVPRPPVGIAPSAALVPRPPGGTAPAPALVPRPPRGTAPASSLVLRPPGGTAPASAIVPRPPGGTAPASDIVPRPPGGIAPAPALVPRTPRGIAPAPAIVLRPPGGIASAPALVPRPPGGIAPAPAIVLRPPGGIASAPALVHCPPGGIAPEPALVLRPPGGIAPAPAIVPWPQWSKVPTPQSARVSGASESQPQPPPTAFTSRDSREFFRRKVQVDLSDPDNDATVTSIYVRGWCVDKVMISVFGRCWPAIETLRTIDLWKIELDPEKFRPLTRVLARCPALTTLSLDANTLTGCPVSELLEHVGQLLHLSLRFCALSPADVQGLGLQLAASSTLQTLNLSNNHLGDLGVNHLAEGLKINRSLLTLNLAGNRVGDVGAVSLQFALSSFPLSHPEVCARRKLISDKLASEVNREKAERKIAELAKENVPPPSTGALKGIQASTRDPKFTSTNKRVTIAGGKLKKPSGRRGADKKSPRPSRTSSPSSSTASASRSLPRQTDKRSENKLTREASARKSPSPKTGIQSPPHTVPRDWGLPTQGSYLTDSVTSRGGHLYLVANRSLISLNLSRNQIGEKGLRALLTIIEEQTVPQGLRQKRQGLLRLELHRNAFLADCPLATEMQRLLKPRQPLLRIPRVDLDRSNVVLPCSLPPLAY